MVHRIKIFLLFILLTITFNYAHAGAAEKWDYDVKPDQNQKLDVKGHKVDGYGNAANDYEYNRKIDPKTAANRTKMGKVGFGRLLKITGWGLLGAAALEGLLESVDWILDPEAQSIWRYKKTGGSDYSCSYKSGGGMQKKFYTEGLESFCPYNVALKRLELRTSMYPSGSQLEFVKWDPELTPSTTSFRFLFKVTKPGGATSQEYLDVPYKNVPAPEGEKEILTPDQLADYANHTHPDYANPELAPKLEPHYSPSIQTDLWKPANPWEYDNSPTVDEVKKELEQAQPEPKDDKIKENEPDPETGGKSFSLPAFCSWATVVCEFIDSFKEQPETPETTEVEIDQTVPVVPNTSYFNWGAYCPFTPGSQTISLENTSAGIDYDLTSWCDLASDIRPFVLAAGALMSFLIAAGIVMGRDD